MIERFNLYDLYGYLLPGLTLLGLLWLPFGMALSLWPPLQLGSAIFALAVGYVSGHILHELSRWAFPSHTLRDGIRLLPSDEVLDDDDRTFSEEIKTKIRNKIFEWYKIDATKRENRRTAFAMCRNELLQKGRVSYAEQFQGLYALMRGVGAGCFLATANVFGWAIGSVLNRDLALDSAQLVTLASTLTFALVCLKVEWSGEVRKVQSRWPNYRYAALLVLLWAGGITAGLRSQSSSPETIWSSFLILTGLLAAAGIICIGTYKSFSQNFASTVYKDFLVLEKKPAGDDKG